MASCGAVDAGLGCFIVFKRCRNLAGKPLRRATRATLQRLTLISAAMLNSCSVQKGRSTVLLLTLPVPPPPVRNGVSYEACTGNDF